MIGAAAGRRRLATTPHAGIFAAPLFLRVRRGEDDLHPGDDAFEDSRVRVIAATPDRVFDVISRLGGRQGWFRYNRLWRLRGWLDRLAGGPGSSRGRRHPEQLSWGDAVDFWRLTELDRGRRLTLRAEMRLPGDAVLDFELFPLEPAGGGMATRLVQTARFRPRGLGRTALPVRRPAVPRGGVRRAAQGIHDAAVETGAGTNGSGTDQ